MYGEYDMCACGNFRKDHAQAINGTTKNCLNEILFGRGFGGITDLTVGPDGYLYVVSICQGKRFRILPE